MRLRYEVMRKDLEFKSNPDRPERSFPLKALAKLCADIYNDAALQADEPAEYYVRDTKKKLGR